MTVSSADFVPSNKKKAQEPYEETKVGSVLTGNS